MSAAPYLSVLVGILLLGLAPACIASDFKCTPTPPDAKGPFYKPNAPVRNSVGTGYVLTGTVKSAKDCSPVPGAKIEFWMTGPHGGYDDAFRGTIMADKSGGYRIESNFPPRYGYRPPHIHLQITANRFETLVSQHYPKNGTDNGVFDLVLKSD